MKVEDFLKNQIITDNDPVAITSKDGTVRGYWYNDNIIPYLGYECKSMGWDEDRGFQFWIREDQDD